MTENQYFKILRILGQQFRQEMKTEPGQTINGQYVPRLKFALWIIEKYDDELNEIKKILKDNKDV